MIPIGAPLLSDPVALPADDRELYEELKKKLERLEQQVPARPQTFGFYAPSTASAPVDVLPMKGFYPLVYRPEELAASIREQTQVAIEPMQLAGLLLEKTMEQVSQHSRLRACRAADRRRP